MNINPLSWFRGKETSGNAGGQISRALREAAPLGPWSDAFGAWVPRTRSPWLLETLREAIPVLDGGINRLVTMDGIIEVQGANDALVRDIEEWMRNVPVNDLESGYQAFYASMGGEHYEQGCAVGEFTLDARGREVTGLRVADSKGIAFLRKDGVLRTLYRAPDLKRDWRADGLGQVEAILRGSVQGDALAQLHGLGYVELDPAACVYALHKPEADNPYGTSILRSLPFVAQILLKMENASGSSWERWGDPAYHVHYATKNRKIDSAEAKRRADKMANELALAVAAKRRGNSVDLSTAAAADDEVTITVIGGKDQVLEIEQPARHMLEQIVAAFGLPSWMLGVQWNQTAGIGEQQSVVVLQESQTRFALRKPALERPIEAMLRARRKTWRPGDWELVQRLPNLMDEQKRAQAEFLRAQTALMLGDRGQPQPVEPGTGVDNNLRAARHHRAKAGSKAASDDEDGGEPWAEPDPELPLIEAATIAALLLIWHTLRDDVLKLLGLSEGGPAWSFQPDALVQMLMLGEGRAAPMLAALIAGQVQAWDRGIANAGVEVSADFNDARVQAAIGRARDRMRQAWASDGLALVRNGLARTYREKIVAALAAGEFDGLNPETIAMRLRQRFGDGEYNWLRLARSEVAMAQSRGKLDLYQQQGISTVRYRTAEDDRVSAICRHLAEEGPYALADAPIPVQDSHPNCRCTLQALA